MPTSAQVHEAVATYAAAVSSADKDAIMACFGSDPQVTDPYPQPTHEGRDSVSAFWDGVLRLGTPVSFAPERLVVAGDRAVFLFTVQVEIGEGENKVRVRTEGYEVLTIDEDGRIAEQVAYWDPASVHLLEA